jgi:hypothetical protein
MPLSNAAKAALRLVAEKRKQRAVKARSRVAALPPIPRIILDSNYVNPITLNFPKGQVVYEIKNKKTGRANYYNKSTFVKLVKTFTDNYNLIMKMNSKKPFPGVVNPMTRNPIYPKDVRRVTVAPKKKTPSPKTAAKKIQSAVRKHQAKKPKRVSK